MTSTRTLRLDDDVEDALKRMSAEEGESVNVIAGRALRKLVEWDRVADKVGMLSLSREMVTRLMATQTLDQARSLGDWVGMDLLGPFAHFTHGAITQDTLLETIELLSRYSRAFVFDKTVSGRSHTWVIRHSMGMKWSAYYQGAAEAVLREVFGVEVKSRITDELCVVEFQLPPEKGGTA